MIFLKRPWLATTLLWLVCCVVLLRNYWPDFAPLHFRDPDDAMRLAQVRDFLGGQSWFDVSQHRVNPSLGGPMHWSRIVDLPIAALILLFRPLVGVGMAERLACILDPLLLLGALSFTYVHVARRLGGTMQALFGLAMLLTSLPILIQFGPLRIDHHDWQIWMAAVALGGALHPDARKGGFIAGGALAFWLHVSSEGLPYAAMFGALFGLRYLGCRDEGARLRTYAIVLAAGSALLLAGTRGWPEMLAVHCDALSPPYLLPMLAVAFLLPLGAKLIGEAHRARRFAVVAIAGATGIALFLLTGQSCIAGPFETLDPLVYRYWYLQVLEGRPIWEQGMMMAGVILLPALMGMAGTIWATCSTGGKTASDRAVRIRWLSLLLLSVGALLISLMVMRAMAVSHLFALPGTAWLLVRLYQWVRDRGSAVARIILTLLLTFMTPLGLTGCWAAIVANPPPAPTKDKADSGSCTEASRLAALATLPPGTILAPIDIGPDILVGTRHSVIGTAHHRNVVGIGAVIRTFLYRPADARRIVAGTGANYVAFCPGLNELRKYAKARPDGLAAMLARGKAPAWLERQSLPGLSPLALYRIRPE